MVLFLSCHQVIRCQKLLPPFMGSIADDCEDTYGSTCTVKCQDGYILYGSINRTCEVNSGHISGYWTGSLALCKGTAIIAAATTYYYYYY